jgi:hypothetical protein
MDGYCKNIQKSLTRHSSLQLIRTCSDVSSKLIVHLALLSGLVSAHPNQLGTHLGQIHQLVPEVDLVRVRIDLIATRSSRKRPAQQPMQFILLGTCRPSPARILDLSRPCSDAIQQMVRSLSQAAERHQASPPAHYRSFATSTRKGRLEWVRPPSPALTCWSFNVLCSVVLACSNCMVCTGSSSPSVLVETTSPRP